MEDVTTLATIEITHTS